jgi:hypothetical protein
LRTAAIHGISILMAATQRAAYGAGIGGAARQPPAAEPALSSIVARVRRRIRAQRAADAAATLSIAAIGSAAIGLCLLKTGHAAGAPFCFGLTYALPPLGLLLGALQPVEPLLPARLLDRALGTPDLLASAWSFSSIAEPERTAFMQACMRAAVQRARHAEPARAMPLRAPRALRPALLLACGLFALGSLRVPAAVPVVVAAHHKPRLLHQDDLQAFAREIASALSAGQADPVVREAASELNALLEAARDGQVDREQALRELRGLERRLDEQAHGEDARALAEALGELGRALGQDSLAQSVADALAQADAAKARAELERLAQKLSERAPKPAENRKLEHALARAAHPARQKEAAQIARARAELERLLRKQRDAHPPSEAEQRLLHKTQRELEQLTREQEQRQAAERKLDELRRELSSAAGQVGQVQREGAAQSLRKAGQALEQVQREQTSAEQRQQLRQRVQELRELISKQRQQQEGQAGKPNGGDGKRLSMERFGRAARGQDGSRGDQRSDKEGRLLMPTTERKPDPTLFTPAGAGSEAMQPGEAERREGQLAGHEGRVAKGQQPTRLASDRVDTQINGAPGQGPTRSEVIREAGSHGFASSAYQRVHGDYERHAEAVLERDRIPGGYRFYVRRYFQLIRPREGSDE